MNIEVVFKAMGDATRLRTLAVLHRRELSVSELVKVLDQPQSTVSRHLKVLRDAGLLLDRRNGHTVLYALRRSKPGLRPTASTAEASLSDRLFDWIGEQSLEEPVEQRLCTVIADRAAMSQRFFDRVRGKWDALRIESFGPSFQMEAFLGLLPDAWTVADIGTGTGYLLPALARHFHRVIAVEPSAAMRGAANERIAAQDLQNVELRNGDLNALPLVDEEVDLVVAALVLHHVPVPEEALGEIFRVGKPGGKVLIIEQTVHLNASFRDRMQDRWWGFEKDDCARLLQAAGYVDVRVKELITADRAKDAPPLFVVTGAKPG